MVGQAQKSGGEKWEKSRHRLAGDKLLLDENQWHMGLGIIYFDTYNIIQ